MTSRLLLRAAALGGLAFSSAAFAQDASIAYISPIAAQPGQQLMAQAMEEAATAAGWEWRLLDANLSADRQVSHVDTLITFGVDAFASWSLDPNAVAGAYSRANAAGIAVIGVNSEGEGVTNTVWWGINTCGEGNPHQQMAAWIAERNPDARIVVIGGPPVESITNNVNCFRAAAEEAGLELVTQVDNLRDSAANASTLIADVLIRNPDVDVFWAYNDASALGASAAIYASGGSVYSGENTEGIMVFGLNGDDDAVQAVRDGRMTGTWDSDPYGSGFAIALAMKTAIENPGEQTPLVVESVLYTSENIESWLPAPERGYSLDNIPLVQ